ncbi:unnamed protein product [Rotaria socialis]|uniref:Proteasome activator PA28 C-terminal domain-containing protein n=2 Tax=Rotaria socialis TaxID=392032 RepID=A0A817MAU4_9BILA|nr:unnamed protein product [Rotaria socialis]CAF3404195.1 unnamed protein product [Rotaria socialis]
MYSSNALLQEYQISRLSNSPVQNYLHNLIEIVEYLAVWLELEISSYSDRHDCSAVIQNEINDEITSIKLNCVAYIDQIVDYREQRALASKELFKRPHVDDNYHLIANLDYQLRRNFKVMLI